MGLNKKEAIEPSLRQALTKVPLVDRACRGPIVDGVFAAGPNEHVWYRSPDALYYDENEKLLWEFFCPAFLRGNCTRVKGVVYPCPMNTPALLEE